MNVSILDVARRMRRRLRQEEDPVVANARRLVAASRDGLDVLQLGDSMLTWHHPDDADPRLFPEMVAGVFAGRRFASFHGPGYHAGVYHRFLALLAARERLPRLLIVPLTYRQCAQMWDRHPRNGYAYAMAQLDGVLASRRPGWAIAARRQRKDPAVMERFRGFRHPCEWEGPRTNGEFIDAIKGAEPTPTTVRLTYTYLHGEALDPDRPAVRRVEELGRFAADLGVPVIAYENPVNVETGASVCGEQFVSHTQRNVEIVSQALLAGGGDLIRVCRTGTSSPASSFVFAEDGVEHQRDTGRLMLAGAIAEHAAATGW